MGLETCFSPQEALHFAFDAAKVYSHTLERFRLFFKENESVDLDAVRQQDHGNVEYIKRGVCYKLH